MKNIQKNKKIGSKIARFFFYKKVTKSKMADPLDDKVLTENSLGCVMKSLIFMVDIARVIERLPRRPLPHPPNSPLVKEDLTEKVHKPNQSLGKRLSASL